MKIQLLVTTMFQKDFSKLEEMNISGDVLFVNQDDRYEYNKIIHNNGRVAEMITTPTRGTSKNRNIAIEFCDKTCDYVVFVDDDILMNDNYEQLIISELEAHPNANIVKFSIHDIAENLGTPEKPVTDFTRATRRRLSSCGGCGLAIKRGVFGVPNMRFNEHFDPGGEVYCGGDTVFYQECVKEGIAIYLSPVDIAGIDQSDSSWFEGFYNEKYFRSAAQCIAHVYPQLSKLIVIRSAYRFSKNPKCQMKYMDILKAYYSGIKEYSAKRKALR